MSSSQSRSRSRSRSRPAPEPATSRQEMLEGLEKDIRNLGMQVNFHERMINCNKESGNRLDEEILKMQGILGEYQSLKESVKESRELVSEERSEEETVGNILKHENSAAALWYRLIKQGQQTGFTETMTSVLKDVVGIVATLGKVHDPNLSRLLSEYLGLKKMMGIVCTTSAEAKALETYNEDGSVCCEGGLHGLNRGTPLAGRFLVICLEQLRPYTGPFVEDDDDDETQPRRRLDLDKPRLPGWELPHGFLGFAVNMIHVESSSGLRETLFYYLFSHLQVYRSRQEMMDALPLISHGAISLDGGMILSNGVFRFGTRDDIDVIFPLTSKAAYYIPDEYVEMKQVLKDKEVEKKMQAESLQQEESALLRAKYGLAAKMKEFEQLQQRRC